MPVVTPGKRGPKCQPEACRGQVTTLRLTRQERELADRLAKREGTTRTDILREALLDYHLRTDV